VLWLRCRPAHGRRGERHVFFVDAAHFVYGTLLCCLWSFVRLYVRAAIEEVVAWLPSKHKDKLASLLTLDFQAFDNVSLLAA
jgi:hypothetical protein